MIIKKIKINMKKASQIKNFIYNKYYFIISRYRNSYIIIDKDPINN